MKLMLHLESMLELFERYFYSVSDVILFNRLKQSFNLFDRFERQGILCGNLPLVQSIH